MEGIKVYLFCSGRANHEEMVQDDVSLQEGSELPSHQQPPILSLLFWSDSQCSSEPGCANDFQQSLLKISVAISIQEQRECFSGPALRYMSPSSWKYKAENFLRLVGNFAFFSSVPIAISVITEETLNSGRQHGGTGNPCSSLQCQTELLPRCYETLQWGHNRKHNHHQQVKHRRSFLF